ncbi:MAG TPA: hypothetical protein DCF68_20670, partial [Cyanothece sp. UBA12306]|nr:hypothetical protein [Cyanothece sp. UBA12306]
SVSMKQITKQVETTRQQKFAGVSFFFYESLWNFGIESPKERKIKLKKIFPNLVDRPTVKNLRRSTHNS